MLRERVPARRDFAQLFELPNSREVISNECEAGHFVLANSYTR